MVIWTIVPQEALFSRQDETGAPHLQDKKEEEINYAGCRIAAQAVNENQYQIVRLITTDPNDYLNNKLEPGKIIHCKKVFEELAAK